MYTFNFLDEKSGKIEPYTQIKYGNCFKFVILKKKRYMLDGGVSQGLKE